MTKTEKINKLIAAKKCLEDVLDAFLKIKADKSDGCFLCGNAGAYAAKIDNLLNAKNGFVKLLCETTEQLSQNDERGIKYQIIAYDAEGKCVHAGVHSAETMNLETAIKLEKDWVEWRDLYVKTHPGNYPLADSKKTVFIVAFPVDDPDKKQTFQL